MTNVNVSVILLVAPTGALEDQRQHHPQCANPRKHFPLGCNQYILGFTI